MTESTSINRDLVLEFFLKLSRLEYALKLSGYFTGNENKAKPDWDRFANEISNQFNSASTVELETACTYYLALPPYKQVVTHGNLDWNRAMPEHGSDISKLLVLVRRVRNNLFHGGKYNPQEESETERNTLLLQFGLIILNEALRLSPRVNQAYEQAAI